MEKSYSVTMGTQIVGTATVRRQGLYSRIVCHCCFDKPRFYHLEMECNGQSRRLGVLIPSGNRYLLETTIPAKYINEDNIRFYIPVLAATEQRQFLSIEQGKLFSGITK